MGPTNCTRLMALQKWFWGLLKHIHGPLALIVTKQRVQESDVRRSYLDLNRAVCHTTWRDSLFAPLFEGSWDFKTSSPIKQSCTVHDEPGLRKGALMYACLSMMQQWLVEYDFAADKQPVWTFSETVQFPPKRYTLAEHISNREFCSYLTYYHHSEDRWCYKKQP